MLGRIAILSLVLITRCALAQCDPVWAPGEGIPGVAGSTVNTVNAITTWDRDGTGSPLVVVGGNFRYAGRCTTTNVAAWNGSTWDPLGTNLVDTVHALCVYNGDLYVGCEDFNINSTGSVKRWNGSSWVHIGGGLQGHVYAVIVYNGELLVGGT